MRSLPALVFLSCLLTACGDSGEAVDAGTSESEDVGASEDAGRSEDSGIGGGNDASVGGMCVDTAVYPDEDGDQFGVDDGSTPQTQCLRGNETGQGGFARADGDCGPMDAWRNPGAAEICGDNLDDDCDGQDAPCPTTNVADLDIPAWDCVTGSPPSNVLAHALFADGAPYFEPNGCFMVYEGLKGEFWVNRVNLTRSNTSPECDTINGCTCPSLNNWSSYDRRLYAFTRQDVDPCPIISMRDHGGESQPVSNDCRKYLYQLHYYDIPYTYFASGLETAERRLDLFPVVEIACAEDAPHNNLPFASLLNTSWERNASYVAK